MRRRRFHQTLGAGAAALRGLRLAAAPGAEARCLVVFLRGGCDGTNVLVPIASDFYREARPTLAIPRPDPAQPQAALALDGTWGLHPALRESLLPLWKLGQAAFVPFAGSPDLSRSHFETQDSIEAGEPLDGPRDYRSGFLNRLAEVLGDAHPIAFTDGLPLCLKGDLTVPNVSLRQYGKAPFDDRQMAILASMYRGHPLEDRVVEGLQLRREVARDFQMDPEAGRNAISAKGFELEARRMGRMMAERFNLGFLDVAGWDTHVNQAPALAGSLDNLGRGLSAFAQELGRAWERTVVVVLSEFGRTFRENGTRGTDHGHGGVAWILGGALHGGRVAGEQVALERKYLFQDRDHPVLTDYRCLLGGLFRRLYGLDQARLARVFPRAAPLDLGLL